MDDGGTDVFGRISHRCALGTPERAVVMVYVIALLVLAALLVCSAFVVLIALARLEENPAPARAWSGRLD
jgi:hypothetical protein